MEHSYNSFFILESSFRKSIIKFCFNKNTVKIFLPIELSIVKDIFNEYFYEYDYNDIGNEKQYVFRFRENDISLENSIKLSNYVSNVICQKLEYVKDYMYESNKDYEIVPLEYSLIKEYDIHKIAENIIELLGE